MAGLIGFGKVLLWGLVGAVAALAGATAALLGDQLATLPSWVTDVGTLVVVVGGLFGVLAVVTKSPPARWVWRTLVTTPLSTWLKGLHVDAAKEVVTSELKEPIQELDTRLTAHLDDSKVRTEQFNALAGQGAQRLARTEGRVLKLEDSMVHLEMGQDRIERSLIDATRDRSSTDSKIDGVLETIEGLHGKYVEDTNMQDQRLARLEGEATD